MSQLTAAGSVVNANPVYEYRLSPNGPWLIAIMPGCDLTQVWHSARTTFGAKLVDLRAYQTGRHDAT